MSRKKKKAKKTKALPEVDLSLALQSFQEAFERDEIQVQPGKLDAKLYLHPDTTDGGPRLTYVRLEGRTVTALVSCVFDGFDDGVPGFQIGYAVPEAYRNQGRAKEIVSAAMRELQHGFSFFPVFDVTATVDADNKPSQRVAEQTIGPPKPMTDGRTGRPAFQYTRRIQ